MPRTRWASLLAGIIVSATATGCMQGCTAAKTVVHNFADLDDHRIFANRRVASSAQRSTLASLPRAPRFMAALSVPDEHGRLQPLERYLEETRTGAFVVIREDLVVYERYGRGFDERSLFNSFSIAKSILGTLVGIAVDEGLIPGLDATVAEICPRFAATAYGPVTVRSLLAMTSGVAEAPSLLPGRAQYYYGDDLESVVAGAGTVAPQGARWRYSEADAQMLGFVLQAAVGEPLSDYLAEKIWKPLGMEADALWSLDREGGREKAFCCISARARDFARFGRLYLDGGLWNGHRLLSPAWAGRAVVPGAAALDGYTHRHLWWDPQGGQGDYYAYGHNGQYLYVNPAARTVIVKFSETHRQDPLPMFRAVARALSAPSHLAELDRLAAATLARR